ncbi:MAG: hypothetical protein QOK00_3487 [Thermoleophilaceae bacterium]|jgi:inosine-uridine nucleoside N-ribohydrolase|nr:hypothetical protein [Thermoleophilaceae bacterium]MEA2403084.1 hypothetical protein [Thermoleophilaceae bacterium]
MTEGPRRVILDTDPGIGPGMDADDVLALMFCLGSPELELQGVTTVFGNVEVGRATGNALRALEAIGRQDVPVAQGMSVPLSGTLNRRSAEEYEQHQSSLGPIDAERIEAGRIDRHASDFIAETVAGSPGEVSLLAVGPLTNVAMAILKRPALKTEIRDITIMGGAFAREPVYGRGNITPVAEYNIWGDPLAAKVVFDAGIPMTAVGLDVTNPAKGTVLYEDQMLELVADKTPFTEFLHEVIRTYIDAPKFDWAEKGCVLYDPVAAATLVDPALVTTERARVAVETQGAETSGQTIAHPSEEGNVGVCVDVDGDAFVQLFTERLRNLVSADTERR